MACQDNEALPGNEARTPSCCSSMRSPRFSERRRLSLEPSTLRAVVLASALALASTGCASAPDSAGSADTIDASVPDAESADSCTPSEPTADASDDCRSLRVHLDVLDQTRKQPLFAEAVAVVMPGCTEPVACRQLSPTAFGCELPTGMGLEAPSDSPSLALDVIAQVNGEERRAQAELAVDFDTTGDDLCIYSGSVAVPLPDCVERDVVAVQGQVLGVVEGAALRVRLWPEWWSDGILWDLRSPRACEIDGTTYRCPASGYRSHYVLEAEVDSQIVAQRDVYVQTDGCALQTLHYDLDPNACDVEVWLGTDARVSAAEIGSVSVDAVDAAPAITCQRSASAAHLFQCSLTAQQAASTRSVTIETNAGAKLSKNKPRTSECPAVFPNRSTTVPPEYGVPNVVLRPQDLRELELLDE